MLFSIIDGLPFYVKDGKAYPVSVCSENGNVEIDLKNGFDTESVACYSISEILAKCENLNSIPEPKRRRVRKNVL